MVLVRRDQCKPALDRLVGILTVAGIRFHHRLSGNSADPHLIHDLRNDFLEIIHVEHGRNTGKKHLCHRVAA